MRGNRCSARNAARNCKTTRNSALHAERASPTRTPPARKPPHVRPILRKRLPCRQTQAPTWPPTPTRLKRPRTRIQPTTSHLLTPQRTLVPQATPPLARHRTKRSRAPSREVLLSKLLGSLQSPITNLARVLNQIAEQGDAPAEAEAEAPAAE